jgi:hypothetical protein
VRIVITVMVASVLCILVFKYFDRSLGGELYPDEITYPKARTQR